MKIKKYQEVIFFVEKILEVEIEDVFKFKLLQETLLAYFFKGKF